MSGAADTVIGRTRIALTEAARPSDAPTDQAAGHCAIGSSGTIEDSDL
jgi:hypothetical protein